MVYISNWGEKKNWRRVVLHQLLIKITGIYKKLSGMTGATYWVRGLHDIYKLNVVSIQQNKNARKDFNDKFLEQKKKYNAITNKIIDTTLKVNDLSRNNKYWKIWKISNFLNEKNQT